MAVTGVGATGRVPTCRFEQPMTRLPVRTAVTVNPERPGDRVALTPAPKFQIAHPVDWLEQKAASLAEPMGMDAKILVNGLVAAPVVGGGVKVTSIVRAGLTISRTTGLRTFAAQAGWKGSFRAVAMAYGKASLRSWAAEGLVVAAAAGAAAVAWHLRPTPNEAVSPANGCLTTKNR